MNAQEFIKTVRGPLSSVKYCTLCQKPVEGVSMFTYRRKRDGDRVGRGAGLAWGGASNSSLIKHINESHPEAVGKVSEA